MAQPRRMAASPVALNLAFSRGFLHARDHVNKIGGPATARLTSPASWVWGFGAGAERFLSSPSGHPEQSLTRSGTHAMEPTRLRQEPQHLLLTVALSKPKHLAACRHGIVSPHHVDPVVILIPTFSFLLQRVFWSSRVQSGEWDQHLCQKAGPDLSFVLHMGQTKQLKPSSAS